MTMLTVSLAQINIIPSEDRQNLTKVSRYLEESAKRNSQLVILPELWNTGYDLSHSLLHARQNQATLNDLCGLAKKYRLAIVGSLLEEENNSIFNTSYWITDNGSILAKYRKIHLFRLMDEHRWLSEGNQLTLVHSPLGNAGLSICYDLRFPEMFRNYALAGAQLLIVSAEWPLRRLLHWGSLLQARAIENQTFMLAVNSVGKTGEEQFAGGSAVIDPWGNILAQADNQTETLMTLTIDLEMVNEVRKVIPVLSDCRPEAYESMSSAGKMSRLKEE
jgi:omega-amidase